MAFLWIDDTLHCAKQDGGAQRGMTSCSFLFHLAQPYAVNQQLIRCNFYGDQKSKEYWDLVHKFDGTSDPRRVTFLFIELLAHADKLTRKFLGPKFMYPYSNTQPWSSSYEKWQMLSEKGSLIIFGRE